MSDERMKTLTMSAAPLATSTQTDSSMLVETPNTMMHAPKVATARNSARPAWRNGGRQAITALIATAPIAGAARSRPSPEGPTWRMSSGEHRQQRSRTAEQHGEEVERDRAEDHRFAPHEPNAGREALRHRLRVFTLDVRPVPDA